MKTLKIPRTDLTVSRIAYGCDRLAGWDYMPLSAEVVAKAVRVINTAYDNGITLYDHADVYGYGKAEAAFGEVLRQSPGLRDKVVIQSKCGQQLPNEGNEAFRVDLTGEHIVSSVEGSLRRLGTDRLDILLLHITDALAEPEEIAQAFDDLKRSGKVRYFGVSNHTATQIALLQRYVREPIVVNQIQLSLTHAYPIADGMEFVLEATEEVPKMLRGFGKSGFANAYASVSGTGILDYCRLHDIQIQAWAPLKGELLNPSANATPRVKQTVKLLAEIAGKNNTAPSAIALAWLLRHPARVIPIIGATNPEHVIDNCAASGVALSREDWYALFGSITEIQSRSVIK